MKYLQTATIHKHPQNKQFALLIETNPVKLIQILVFHEFQLKYLPRITASTGIIRARTRL